MLTHLKVTLPAAVLGVILSGCATTAIPNYVRSVAAKEHRCAEEKVALVERASVHSSPGYWLNVCGDLRYYEREKISPSRKLGAVELHKMMWTYTDRTNDVRPEMN